MLKKNLMISSALYNRVFLHRTSHRTVAGGGCVLEIQNKCKILEGPIHIVISVDGTSLMYTKQYEWCSLDYNVMRETQSLIKN